MSSYHSPHPDGSDVHQPEDPAAEERAEAADRLGEELEGNKTARQEELTHEIYEQLKAGSEVDDIKHLIAQLSRAGTEDAANRQRGHRATGGRP
ncbi:hypothetical protein ACWIG3_12290 [Streptomyces celluloflavus]|uniref:hypothetical protein n=1 Tax=Streptomyces celluloflavus TaxID=58344 RepID=UPI003655D190